MARRLLLVVGLLALSQVAVRAGTTEKQEVQEFVNELALKVAKVRDVVPWDFYPQMELVIFRMNSLAGQWYQIDQWGSQQSRWDELVNIANGAVVAVNEVLARIPEVGEPQLEWGSKKPRQDLESVANDICEPLVAGLRAYAEDTYGIDINVNKMTACPKASTGTSGGVSKLDMGDVEESEDALAPAAAPAPAPAPARRLLAA